MPIFSIVQTPEKKIWFPAKRYGWGWGIPSCWQGWAVIIAFYLLLGIAVLLLIPHHPAHFVFACIVLTAALVAIGYFKGEKPRWRWGKKQD
jgi:uncharacterized membrane protein YhaH (DUF805 family)